VNRLNPSPDDGPSPSARHLTEHPTPPVAAVPQDLAVAEFTTFYRAEIASLVRFLIWTGAHGTDAADLAQDTMIDAFRQWSTITRPRAWVRRIASRKFGRRLANAEEPVAVVDGRPLLPANQDLTDSEHYHEIRRLLALLPARQRQVMAWTFDDYQPHEIAVELGITAQAVRSSLKLARRTLAQYLPRQGGAR
jgi:RNA polymerase sigma factor (sigma-70 family)